MGEEEEITDPSNPAVAKKYKEAGKICSEALKHVMSICKPGMQISQVCDAGDKFIVQEANTLYPPKPKEEEKKGRNLKDEFKTGVAFPTCVSVNHVVGHFSPLASDTSKLTEGDVIKVDLGVHIDGYVAVGAHTFVLGKEGPATEPITGRLADLLLATYYAVEIAHRLLRPGNKNHQITEAIGKVAKNFNVTPVQGVLSHDMTRYVIDGEKVIINRHDFDQKVDKCEFEPHEIYAIDIVMSTGAGKPKEVDARTTVFKRSYDVVYRVKRKASRQILGEINKNYPSFPFTIRNFQESKVRFGIKEIAEHDLVNAYPVLHEKEGEIVSHTKFTGMLMPKSTVRLCSGGFDPAMCQSEYKLDEELENMMKLDVWKPKKKDKKKKKKKRKKHEQVPQDTEIEPERVEPNATTDEKIQKKQENEVADEDAKAIDEAVKEDAKTNADENSVTVKSVNKDLVEDEGDKKKKKKRRKIRKKKK